MSAARAMKPVPLVMLSSKPACDSSENHAPASPAISPPMTTAAVADADRVDAERLGGVGVLADRADPQPEPGAEQHERR